MLLPFAGDSPRAAPEPSEMIVNDGDPSFGARAIDAFRPLERRATFREKLICGE